MEANTTNENEANFRLNIKQTSKGYAYFDTTVRGNTIEEIDQRLSLLIERAKQTCERLNSGLSSE